jgi:hypothetical protein
MALFMNGVSDDLATSVNLGNPKVNSSGGKNIPMFNKHARSIMKFSSPKMLTWGVNENDFDGNGKKSYDMSLQFPSPEYANAESTAFLENIKRLQDFVLKEAELNAKKWFGKPHTKDVVDALYSPLLRYPKNKETEEVDYTKPPSLRIKIPFWDGKFNVEIYDTSGALVFPKEDANICLVVPKGSEVTTLIQAGGIWFAGGKFGVTLRPIQIVVKPKPQLQTGVCHLLSSSDHSDKSEPIVMTLPEDPTAVESDEDPEREYSTPVSTPPVDGEAAPPPAPVKGRKKVVKQDA